MRYPRPPFPMLAFPEMIPPWEAKPLFEAMRRYVAEGEQRDRDAVRNGTLVGGLADELKDIIRREINLRFDAQAESRRERAKRLAADVIAAARAVAEMDSLARGRSGASDRFADLRRAEVDGVRLQDILDHAVMVPEGFVQSPTFLDALNIVARWRAIAEERAAVNGRREEMTRFVQTVLDARSVAAVLAAWPSDAVKAAIDKFTGVQPTVDASGATAELRLLHDAPETPAEASTAS